MDNDLTSMLCEGLQCKAFTLGKPKDRKFDSYEPNEQKWRGGTGDIIDGTATFKVGFTIPPRQAYLDTSITSSYSYFIERGFGIGYPRPIVSLFNIVKPYE